MKLSIVATLYQSAPYVGEFCQRAGAAAQALVGDDYEIVLVNDGSPDNSLELAVQLCDQNPSLVVIDLSRNFGHHKAMMTGLAHAQGERVFLIDSDLEEEPEWLLSFANQMAREQCDVVYGIQERRKGNWFERWTGRWFWKLINTLSDLNLPANIVTARLMDREYVNSLLLHQEREVFMAGLWHITGYKQLPQMINKKSTSKSTYTFSKKMSLMVNSVTSFSSFPLILIFHTGIFILILSLIYILYLLVNWFFLSTPLTGWTSVIASIWLLGGIVISFIGVIGIYLSKIFSESKKRPYTIIRSVHKGRKSSTANLF
jgi:putative glycosyltransferase